MTKLVSVGIVNCNRLFYLKSCLESFLECTSNYKEKEIFIVDNASTEEGTEEYLLEKEKQGIKVFRQEKRDPSNEFAKGLNLICENFSGDYLILLQGDMQFILKNGWLEEYVDFCEKRDDVGCITLDAQRLITLKNNKYREIDSNQNFRFLACLNKPPIMGAADVFYPRKIIEMIYPWHVKNLDHEGGNDSETEMLKKVHHLVTSGLNVFCYEPITPPSCAIYTDMRGTMARVRGNKRYGDYWEAKRNNQYYEYIDYEESLEMNKEYTKIPFNIEYLANPIGFFKMLDNEGNWLKNPIRVFDAKPEDYIELREK